MLEAAEAALGVLEGHHTEYGGQRRRLEVRERQRRERHREPPEKWKGNYK